MELSSWIAPLSSALGLVVLGARLMPALFRREHDASGDGEGERVSIIVPARNEEANLPRLLASFARLEWSNLEVLVVDDESTDRTPAIVEEFAKANPRLEVKLIRGRGRPVGWTGKNWACHQGYEQATGEWLLFTDADTEHEPDSLRRAIARMQNDKLDLLTATPYHRTETLWEKLLGPFQLFMFVATAAFSEPKPGRVFAIGQYLLFRKASYAKQAGHERIRNVLCDDLELAHHCLGEGGIYAVEGGRKPLYHVRMYSSFPEFVKGWRRIFRLGFRHAKVSSSIEMYFVMAALTASMQFFTGGSLLIGLLVSSSIVLLLTQRRFGDFSFAGVVLLPWSLVLFCAVSALAVFDLVTGREFVWRGRSYSKTAD